VVSCHSLYGCIWTPIISRFYIIAFEAHERMMTVIVASQSFIDELLRFLTIIVDSAKAKAALHRTG
jgi:hypothetical protein